RRRSRCVGALWMSALWRRLGTPAPATPAVMIGSGARGCSGIGSACRALPIMGRAPGGRRRGRTRQDGGVRITALAGGIGAARFLRGLLAELAARSEPYEVTVIGNTADDVRLFGLHVSPDLDTVMYTLGGGIHEEQGWGRADETYVVKDELAA